MTNPILFNGFVLERHSAMLVGESDECLDVLPPMASLNNALIVAHADGGSKKLFALHDEGAITIVDTSKREAKPKIWKEA